VIALIYEGNNQRLKNLITAEKIHITLKRSRIAILSVGVAALIGIFSFFNFIAPIAGKTETIQRAGEEVSQMVLVSNDNTPPKVPNSADDFYPVIKER